MLGVLLGRFFFVFGRRAPAVVTEYPPGHADIVGALVTVLAASAVHIPDVACHFADFFVKKSFLIFEIFTSIFYYLFSQNLKFVYKFANPFFDDPFVLDLTG